MKHNDQAKSTTTSNELQEQRAQLQGILAELEALRDSSKLTVAKAKEICQRMVELAKYFEQVRN